MKKIKVAVVGASGRAGGEVVNQLKTSDKFELVAALVASDCPTVGKPCFDDLPQGVAYSTKLEEGIGLSDAVIEFASPSVSEVVAAICGKLRKPLLLATTGHSEDQLARIAEVGSKIPLLVVSNTSIGILVLSEVSKVAKELLGENFDIEIVEAHHKLKKDAPSGTGLTLATALGSGTSESLVRDRTSAPRVRGTNEIGIASIRGGSVAGDHTIYFLGEGERIELTHRAEGRSIFAKGALTLVERLAERSPGIYAASDLILGRP